MFTIYLFTMLLNTISIEACEPLGFTFDATPYVTVESGVIKHKLDTVTNDSEECALRCTSINDVTTIVVTTDTYCSFSDSNGKKIILFANSKSSGIMFLFLTDGDPLYQLVSGGVIFTTSRIIINYFPLLSITANEHEEESAYIELVSDHPETNSQGYYAQYASSSDTNELFFWGIEETPVATVGGVEGVIDLSLLLEYQESFDNPASTTTSGGGCSTSTHPANSGFIIFFALFAITRIRRS
jgi:hypothetical protein